MVLYAGVFYADLKQKQYSEPSYCIQYIFEVLNLMPDTLQ